MKKDLARLDSLVSLMKGKNINALLMFRPDNVLPGSGMFFHFTAD